MAKGGLGIAARTPGTPVVTDSFTASDVVDQDHLHCCSSQRTGTEGEVP